MNLVILVALAGLTVSVSSCAQDYSLSPPADSEQVTVTLKVPKELEAETMQVMYRSATCKRITRGASGQSVEVEGHHSIDVQLQRQGLSDLYQASLAKDGGGACKWHLANVIFGVTYADPTRFGENVTSGAGEIAAFFKAEQHLEQRGSHYPAYRNKDGLGAPYHTTIAHRLPEKAKLYLVPSLSPVDDQHAEQAQDGFIASLNAESRATHFPPYGNPKTGRLVGIGDHFMSKYQPYIHNQLLESINAEREPLLKRQLERQAFEQQMKDYYVSIPEHEIARNRAFLELQNLLGQTLHITHQTEGGAEALQRFDAVADPNAYYEKVYG